MSNEEFTLPVETAKVGWMIAWCQAIRTEHEREITKEEYDRIADAADEKFADEKKESDNNGE